MRKTDDSTFLTACHSKTISKDILEDNLVISTPIVPIFRGITPIKEIQLYSLMLPDPSSEESISSWKQ